MNFIDIIIKKRNKKTLTTQEINYIVDCIGKTPDYQFSSLLMAICLNGLDKRETADLTKAMLYSGDIIDLSEIPGIKIDKHSTGGVADTTTLVLAPLVSSCGLPVAKMSGRGLGHTGGTLDKLESIPGFNISLTKEQAVKQVNDIGLAIMGQTKSLVPADGYLYKLRDVTGTIDSIPLIAASIMSKKLASGADGIVLDVKCGSGAFMKNIDDARELARTMVDIGKMLGKKVVAVISDMDQPLGNNVGNTLEVIEAIGILKGEVKGELTEVSLILGSEMLVLGGIAENTAKAREMLEENIRNGKGIAKFGQFILAQGGNAAVIDNYSLFKQPLLRKEIYLKKGFVGAFDTEAVGKASAALGAGRISYDMPIDPSAGIIINRRKGEFYDSSEPFAVLFSDSEEKMREGTEIFVSSVKISDKKTEKAVFVPEIIR